MLELYKVVQGHERIEDYRNGFVNLGTNYFLFAEPVPAKQHGDIEYSEEYQGPVVSIPPKWTIWDVIELKQGSMTIGELLTHLETTY